MREYPHKPGYPLQLLPAEYGGCGVSASIPCALPVTEAAFAISECFSGETFITDFFTMKHSIGFIFLLFSLVFITTCVSRKDGMEIAAAVDGKPAVSAAADDAGAEDTAGEPGGTTLADGEDLEDLADGDIDDELADLAEQDALIAGLLAPGEGDEPAAGADGADAADGEKAAAAETAKRNRGIAEGPADFPAAFVARAGREGETLWQDTYRYARATTLRVIERKLFSPDAKTELIKMPIPRFVEKDNDDRKFVEPSTSFISVFLADTIYEGVSKIVYTTDSKRRIVSEAFYDDEEKIVGEMRNVWNNDRLLRVEWKGGDNERVVEYTYNKAGDRTSESDYNNGVLERKVTVDGSREIELIYKNGIVILEAVWEDGRKLSERRFYEPRRRGR